MVKVQDHPTDARVRPARSSDKEPLMNFIRHVWGGHDYIPYVWDDWLHDRTGKMFVVEVDGVPVGMNKVNFPEDGSAWFQGVRVHPSFRGQGLATMLGENSMMVARKRGVSVFRLTTGSWNFPSRRQTARMGFSEVARFGVYAPPKRFSAYDEGVARIGKDEAASAYRAARASREFPLGAGSLWRGFVVASLTRDVFDRLVARGAVFRLGDAVAVVQPTREGPENWEEVGFVGGPVKDAIKLVKSSLARAKGADRRWVYVPRGSPIIHFLRDDGFERGYSQILFQRRVAKG